MSHNILLVPIGSRAGLSSVSLGLLRAIERLNVRVDFFKPISQRDTSGGSRDASVAYLLKHGLVKPRLPMSLSVAEHLVSQGKMEQLLEEIVAAFSQDYGSSPIVLIEGLITTEEVPWAYRLNLEIAKTMQADIIFVVSPGAAQPHETQEDVEIFYNNLGGSSNESILGVVVNKIGAPEYIIEQGHGQHSLLKPSSDLPSSSKTQVASIEERFRSSAVPLLASVAWNPQLSNPKVNDVAEAIGAVIVSAGDQSRRRLKGVTLCDHSVEAVLEGINPGFLMVTSADRVDVVLAVCLAVQNGVEVGGLLLTSGATLSERVADFCQSAFQTGLPVLLVESDSLQVVTKLQHLDFDFPVDDKDSANAIQDYVADRFSSGWLSQLTENRMDRKLLSPPAFRYQLTQLARESKKCIILPEGDEPRTLRAACLCAESGIAKIKLMGCPETLRGNAQSLGLALHSDIQIVDPEKYWEKYIPILVELRKHRGMTETQAREEIKDNVMLATLMLHQGEVDGLVSGAVHTTANTIRPALQLIKTAPGNSIVSSIFFMLLPDQVLVYGDCAINPNPTASELSEIAIQSAQSAQAFGIEPRVALISYSTGSSGDGVDVDKVREATDLVRKKRPDLLVDGPLQYDAAITEAIAKSKAPKSPVAGHANVLIFPDLNTGNTTYKAVQRSMGLLSIGPMLQGLNKPVNDLSRGASVEDIVYTIALTAIQATK